MSSKSRPPLCTGRPRTSIRAPPENATAPSPHGSPPAVHTLPAQMSGQDASSEHCDRESLSEAQLRQLYDEEEVQRFLSLFSAYATEVRLASTGSTESRTEDGPDTTTEQTTPLSPSVDRSLSEHIAYAYILPYLPPATGATPTFTLKRFTSTISRLYLAMFPLYQAFLLDLARLALWQDYQRSLRHCMLYWFLWFYDLLLPALVFRVVFGLIRRRLSTYPTLKELQERRQETARALEFGEAVQRRLSVTTIGPMEIWRLFKTYRSGEKDKAKLVVRDEMETDEERNLKQDVLFALNGLADLHERVKNIFTWRRPDVSRRYLAVMIVVWIGTLVLPAKWIAKLAYWFGGTLFWHVTPVIAALPRVDGARALRLFWDAPTDVDYAMELIAERIAKGENVDVPLLRSYLRRASDASTSTDNLSLRSFDTSRNVRSSEDDGIDWKKWNSRVARGKLFVEEGRRFLSPRTGQSPISGDTADVRHLGAEEAHTFLAQYSSCPGLITLTPHTLFFASLTGTRARLVIPRDRLRGVRKSGLVKGIAITWATGELTAGEEREDRFHWVGNRDELFARLVGSGGGRWTTV